MIQLSFVRSVSCATHTSEPIMQTTMPIAMPITIPDMNIFRNLPFPLRGPRIIGAVENRRHPWGEQHRIEPRTKRNHSWANLGYLTSGDHFSRERRETGKEHVVKVHCDE